MNSEQPADSNLDSRAAQDLRTDHLKHDLKRRSVSGGVTMVFMQGLRFVFNVLGLAVLARILQPADFGLLAMITAITGFVALFRTLGLTQATIQRTDITPAQVNALFWANVALGTACAGVSVLLTPVVAWFYGDARIAHTMPIIALAFIAGGLAAQHRALLTRQMRFPAIATVEIVAMVVGLSATVLLAMRGFSYIALAARPVVEETCAAAGVWMANRWRPGWPRRGVRIRELVRFGGHLTGSNVMMYLARNMDNVLVGWRCGAQSLGFYSYAYILLYVPIQQISTPLTHVAIPALSRLQEDPPKYREYFAKGLEIVGTFGMPLVMALSALAEPLVLTVLGPSWERVVPIFRWLTPAAFVGTVTFADEWIYVSLGRTDRRFRWTLRTVPLILLGFALGVLVGPEGVAAAFSLASVLLFYPGYAYCLRGSPLTLRDINRALWRPAVASLVVGALTFAAARFLLPQNWIGLVAGAVLYAALYLAAWMVLPGGRRHLAGILRSLRALRDVQRP